MPRRFSIEPVERFQSREGSLEGVLHHGCFRTVAFAEAIRAGTTALLSKVLFLWRSPTAFHPCVLTGLGLKA